MARSYHPLAGIWLGALLLSGTSGAAQQAGQTVVKRGVIERDLYAVGGAVDVRADARGDVVVAGGRVVIEQRVAQDVLAAGGTVDIAAEVLDDVRAAGGTVILRGPISGDAIAAGGTVLLTPEGAVGERAWLAGGTVEIAGRVGTQLKASAGRITISGTVDGDVDLIGDEIVVSATARITGSLTYRSQREARIDPAAQVQGGITRIPLPRRSLAARIATRLLVLATLGLLGAVLILIFPRFAASTGGVVRGEPWKALAVGLVVLIGTPIAAIAALATVVGAALGVVTAVAFGLSLVIGVLAGALAVGETIVGALRGAGEATTGERVAAVLAGLVILMVLALLPVVGGAVWLAALLFGLGGFQIAAHRAWRAAREGAPATAS